MVYLSYNIVLECSIINAIHIHITSFGDQEQGLYSVKILSKLDVTLYQEQRKKYIQSIKDDMTLRRTQLPQSIAMLSNVDL